MLVIRREAARHMPLRPCVRCCHHVAVPASASVPSHVQALGLLLRHGFASHAEEAALVAIADQQMRGQLYESEHYDSVITSYRECAVSDFSADADADAAVRRLRLTAWQVTDGARRRGAGVYPEVQIIDMPPDGHIKAHRDNFKLFGEFTA
eukprot:COSAG05_NODE_11407_length_515_cov_0.612981_1_plen_150_part_01